MLVKFAYVKQHEFRCVLQKSAMAHRLRVQMQRALRKTAEQLKEEQRHKLAEQMEQRRVDFSFYYLL